MFRGEQSEAEQKTEQGQDSHTEKGDPDAEPISDQTSEYRPDTQTPVQGYIEKPQLMGRSIISLSKIAAPITSAAERA